MLGAAKNGDRIIFRLPVAKVQSYVEEGDRLILVNVGPTFQNRENGEFTVAMIWEKMGMSSVAISRSTAVFINSNMNDAFEPEVIEWIIILKSFLFQIVGL